MMVKCKKVLPITAALQQFKTQKIPPEINQEGFK
jgi:hypothetical protein